VLLHVLNVVLDPFEIKHDKNTIYKYKQINIYNDLKRIFYKLLVISVYFLDNFFNYMQFLCYSLNYILYF